MLSLRLETDWSHLASEIGIWTLSALPSALWVWLWPLHTLGPLRRIPLGAHRPAAGGDTRVATDVWSDVWGVSGAFFTQ